MGKRSALAELCIVTATGFRPMVSMQSNVGIEKPGKPLRKTADLPGYNSSMVYYRLVLAAGKLGGSAVGRARLQPRSFC